MAALNPPCKRALPSNESSLIGFSLTGGFS
jgi:hypothetical protein